MHALVPRRAAVLRARRPVPRRRCAGRGGSMRRLVAIVLAIGLAAVPAIARKERVPIEGKGRAIVVEATINQRVTGRFILDTGASYCVISKDTASEASLSGRKDGRKVRMTTASGAVMEATLGQARRIDIGN